MAWVLRVWEARVARADRCRVGVGSRLRARVGAFAEKLATEQLPHDTPRADQSVPQVSENEQVREPGGLREQANGGGGARMGFAWDWVVLQFMSGGRRSH